MVKKNSKIAAALLAAGLCMSTLAGCGSTSSSTSTTEGTKAGETGAVTPGGETDDAKTTGDTAGADKASGESANLTFMIWDTNQQPGMEAMAAAFMEKNPDIKITVELTPWDEYWTKLQAAATGGSMPDIFWMHPEQVYTFVDGAALMDMTDLISGSEIDLSNYPESIGQDFNIDGRQYGIPKDYSTMGLWYNKDLFDKAGVAYPDDTWTWETWYEAAGKLTDKENGVYGMIAQANSQDFYYNLIWANGSDVIDENETKSLYAEPATIEAIKYGVSFIEAGYAPTTADIASTTALQYFESGKAAMLTAGSWYAPEFTNIEGLNCDVAPLPKSVQRGSICGGMSYSIAANTKYPEAAWKFVEYLGSKEANIIQAQSGAAISAFKGSQEDWVKGFPGIQAQVFVDAAEYGYSTQYCRTRLEWQSLEEDTMSEVFAGNLDPETGCKQLAEEVQAILDENQ